MPTISCLTVTRDRFALLQRAVRSFCDQTYPARELVIVCDGTPRHLAAIADLVASLGRPDIRLHVPEGPRRTLGALRNLSFTLARGEILCQWDDDDCSHPDRLARQAAHLAAERADACLLTDHLQFFEGDRTLSWAEWTYGGRVGGMWRLAPGTLMMRRDPAFRYPEHGAAASRGEDTALLAELHRHRRVVPLSEAGHLYLYTFHGRNTFPEEHHRNLTASAAPIDFLQRHERSLREALRYYPLPRPVRVLAAGQRLFQVM